MKDYLCPVCHQPFQRYPSQVSNDTPTCSKKCQAEKFKTSLTGKNNPNFQHGRCCELSLCRCGLKKDNRAAKCARCSKRSFPKDAAGRITEAHMVEAVTQSKTFLEAAKKCGASRSRVAGFIKEKNIDISHFRHCNFRPYTAENILCITPYRINGTLKKFLRQNKLLEYKCAHCFTLDTWNGKPLTLEIDHVNGNPCDNRIENLRFLCPNCHSQTPTSRGKKKKYVNH